jgi:hypothetical protein
MSDPPTGSPTAAVPDDDALLGMLSVYLPLALFLAVCYSCLLRHGRLLWLLEPKGPARWDDLFSLEGWLFQLRESDFVARCGLDAYMTLRAIRLSARMLFAYACVALPLLLPAYHAQARSPECERWCLQLSNGSYGWPRRGVALLADDAADTCLCTLVDSFSLGNVPSGSSALWLPVLALCCVTASGLWLLQREYQAVARVRAAYWMSTPPEMFTVLADELPARLELRSRAALRAHFERLFPGQVLSVEAARFADEGPLRLLREAGVRRADALVRWQRAAALGQRERERLARRRHRAHDAAGDWQQVQEQADRQHTQQHADTDEVWAPCCLSLTDNWLTSSCLGLGSDARLGERARHWRAVFLTWDREFRQLQQAHELLEQQERDGALTREVRACFVTFRSASAAAVASQVVLHHTYDVATELAPEPDDVRWDSLGASRSARACSSYVARGCFVLLVVFWGALTSLVASMSSVDALANQFPTLGRWLARNAWAVAALQQAAPLLLTALMAVVNPLVSLLARVEVAGSESRAEHVATQWLFTFLVLEVFVFFGVSGSLLRTIGSVLDHPAGLVDALATSIPAMASFYIQFFVTKFATSLAADLFRVSALASHAVRRAVFGPALTERDRKTARCGCAHVSFPAHCGLASLNANMLLVAFIATTYAVICPLLVPVALCFFCAAYLVYAKVFMSASMQRFDSGGTAFPLFFWCYTAALITAQLTLMGLLGLKKGFAQQAPVLLLALATLMAAHLIDTHYRRLVLNLPLDIAAAVDLRVDADRAKEVPAAAWQYGALTSSGEPNYFGRHYDLASGRLKSKVAPLLQPAPRRPPPPVPGAARTGTDAGADAGADADEDADEDADAPLGMQQHHNPFARPDGSSAPLWADAASPSAEEPRPAVNLLNPSHHRWPLEVYAYHEPVTTEPPSIEPQHYDVLLDDGLHEPLLA